MGAEFHLVHRGQDPLDECTLGELAGGDVDVDAESAIDEAGIEPGSGIDGGLADNPVADGHD